MIKHLWLEATTIPDLNTMTHQLQLKYEKWPTTTLTIVGVTSPREGCYLLHYKLERPENVAATPPIEMSGILTRIGAM